MKKPLLFAGMAVVGAAVLVWLLLAARKPHEAEPVVRYTESGKTLATNGRITEAVVAFNRGIALAPTDPQPYIGLAVLYESVDRPDLAVETLDQLRAANPTAKGLACRLAEACLGAEDLPQARVWGEKAVAEGTDPARAHSVYGITMLRFRYWDTAAEHLQKAQQAAPNDVEIPPVLLDVYLQQASYAKAAQLGEQLLSMAPRSARLHYKIGWAYGRQPQHSDTTARAVQHLKQASELAPQWFEPWAELGRLYKSLGRKDEAIACFQRAWSLNKAVPGVLYNLADLLRQCGDAQRAAALEADFHRLMKEQERFMALRRDYNSKAGANDARSALALASVEGRSRMYGVALHRLHKLLTADPSNVEALRLYIRLDQAARTRYPDYLRPGPGLSAPGL